MRYARGINNIYIGPELLHNVRNNPACLILQFNAGFF